MTKNCPCLKSDGILVCSITNYYVPSAFEIEEYCKTRRYEVCPFFKFKDQFALHS